MGIKMPFYLIIVLIINLQSSAALYLTAKNNAIQPDSLPESEKLDLDSLMKIKNNIYFLKLNDDTLSLCCYNFLDITDQLQLNKFQKTPEPYYEGDKLMMIDVYTLGNSYIKTFVNTYEGIDHADLVYGEIKTTQLKFNDGIRIGMDKNDLLGKVFRKSSAFNNINSLRMLEDTEGDFSTTYNFKDGKLTEIIFDSDYNWMDKKLKR